MKHAELIRAALDGKPIQRKSIDHDPMFSSRNKWVTFTNTRLAVAEMAAEYTSFEYRVEPAPDVVRYGKVCNIVYEGDCYWKEDNKTVWTKKRSGQDNVRATFDGATGNLKSLEIV